MDAQVPHSDDFGHSLAVQAQSGMVWLLLALDGIASSAPDPSASEAAETVVNALDNYEYFTRAALFGRGEDGKEYELLDRKLAWQREVLGLLNGPALTDVARLVRLRNRAYAVPIAV